MSGGHKEIAVVEGELNDAGTRVKVGGIYTHYKDRSKRYEVIGFGLQEATDKICVFYKSLRYPNIVFVRDLDNWLEDPEPGKKRFELVEHEK